MLRTYLVALAGCAALLSQATEASSATVTVGNEVIALPGSATVPVSVAMVGDAQLGAFTIEIQYDTAIATLSACDSNINPSLDSVLCFEPTAGRIRAAGFAAFGVGGSFDLVNLVFDSVAAGSSELALAVEDFTDPSATPVAVTAQNGLLVVESGGQDQDGDGVSDALDNCVAVANPDQRDTNGDGFGNRCDADLNNDCVTNVGDLFLFRGVFFSDDADADFTGDGVVNASDLFVLRTLFLSPPGPNGSGTCP